MTDPFRQDTIETWAADFSESDGIRRFTPATQEHARTALTMLLSEACRSGKQSPGNIQQDDVKRAMEIVSRQNWPLPLRQELSAVCAAFLCFLEQQGRLGHGRALGAFVQSLPLTSTAVTSAPPATLSAKPKTLIRPGTKLKPNDPCPCGSGKKFKKCCQNMLGG